MVTQHNSAVWPVPYACAQPYHPGSGSHGQLFRRSCDILFFTCFCLKIQISEQDLVIGRSEFHNFKVLGYKFSKVNKKKEQTKQTKNKNVRNETLW